MTSFLGELKDYISLSLFTSLIFGNIDNRLLGSFSVSSLSLSSNFFILCRIDICKLAYMTDCHLAFSFSSSITLSLPLGEVGMTSKSGDFWPISYTDTFLLILNKSLFCLVDDFTLEIGDVSLTLSVDSMPEEESFSKL